MRRSLAGLPLALWIAGGIAVGWYVYARRSGKITPSPRGILLEAFDEPRERSEILRGIVTGLVSGIVSVYLVRRILRGAR